MTALIRHPVMVAFTSILLAGCASHYSDTSESNECDVHSLASITANPLSFQNAVFCGEVFVWRFRGTMRITQTANELPSYDVAFLVPAEGRRWLGEIGDTPKQFFIRARVEPQVECFRQRTDPLDEEGCVPFRRPVHLYIMSARIFI